MKLPFSMPAVSVATTLTTIGSLILEPSQDTGTPTGATFIALELQNHDGAIALADFELQGQTHPDSNWHTLISGATWGTVAGILKHKVGALNTLAAGARAMAVVEFGPLYAIRLQAKSASSTVSTSARGLLM